MEKLSFAEGRVLVRYPKGWPKAVLKELDEVGVRERVKFVERLRRYKDDRMVSLGEPYDPNIPWINNVADLPSDKLDGVILDKAPPAIPVAQPVEALCDLDEDFFATPREIRCENTPDQLFNVAQLILSETSIAYFIDPYFQINNDAWAKVLARFADGAARTGKCKRFVVYTTHGYLPKSGSDWELSRFRKHLRTDGGKLCISLNFINKDETNYPLHARYFLAQKAGLRYDKGFASQIVPSLVDISILDRNLHDALFKFYDSGAKELHVSASWSWQL